MPAYYLYILQCADNSLYTGITTDVARRFGEHAQGAKGAKYTSAHAPQKIVYQQKFPNRSSASIEEARIKKLRREEKLKLIASQ